MQRFFTLETVKPKAKSWNSLPAEQLSEAEDNQMDGVSMRIMRITSSRSQETEELKDKLVSISAMCGYPGNKVTKNKVPHSL